MSINDIHTGKLIRQVLYEKGHTVDWFAKQICCHKKNAYKIFSKQHINTDLLALICRVLKFNFFTCLSDSLDEELTLSSQSGDKQ
jgi:hypothetical protein